MKLSSSEKYIQQLFQSRYGVTLKKIDERRGNDGRTPDFEYIRDGQRAFVCELKDFRDVPPSEKDGWTVINHPDGSIESYGNDNAINRVSKGINEAYKQLAKYSIPKIIIFLNYTPSLDVKDLEETFNGFSILGIVNNTKYINYFARRASEGKIKDIKKEIDLFIWVDSALRRISLNNDNVYFRTVTESGRKIVQEYFGNLGDIG